MIALAAIIATGCALQAAVGKVGRAVILKGHEPTQHGLMVLFYSLIIAMLAAAIVCSLLHTWMLGKPQASGPAQLARGTNA
jgi:cytochrome c biogenesis protein ResB